MIMILDHDRDEYGQSVELQSEKKAAYVRKNDVHIQVICRNASNSAWRGAGRFFNTWDEAIEGYKSSAMKELIAAAKDIIQ